MYEITEKQRLEALAACERIETAIERQRLALENIARIFDNVANGRDPNDGLHKFEEPATCA